MPSRALSCYQFCNHSAGQYLVLAEAVAARLDAPQLFPIYYIEQMFLVCVGARCPVSGLQNAEVVDEQMFNLLCFSRGPDLILLRAHCASCSETLFVSFAEGPTLTCPAARPLVTAFTPK
jgi:hypothetical protein